MADTTKDHTYRYWQNRILLTTIVGYTMFYFVRKNLSVAMPAMEQSLGISKTQLGLFLSLHGVLYGISKFINGFLGDRWNARWYLASGLALCAVVNYFFGLSTSVVTLGVLWMMNGWFQGTGAPPCARLMAHWFPPQQLATKMSIWNTSHSAGAGLVVVLCGYLVVRDWRLCFYVPAVLAMGGAVLVAILLRDTPESLGLPPVAGTESSNLEADKRGRAQLVFHNRYIWILAAANFFVYTVRYGILDWGPTFLKQARHVDLTSASWMVAAFEGAGLIGILTSGWLTDHVFGGRGGRTCLFYMILCVASLVSFWKLPHAPMPVSTALLCISGFFVYGPQALVGISAVNLATKRAASAALGLTGLFAYLSTIVSGAGVGWLVERWGWDAGFMVFVVAGVIGVVLFACCWPAHANGYLENANGLLAEVRGRKEPSFAPNVAEIGTDHL